MPPRLYRPEVNMIEALERGLRDLAAAQGSSQVGAGVVDVSAGVPVYEIDAEDLSRGEGLRAAGHAGWRFIVLTENRALFADVRGAEFIGVHSGPAVADFVTVAKRFEESGIGGDARLLCCAALAAEALWVTNGADLFWSYTPEPVEAPVDWPGLHADWSDRAEALMRRSENIIEEIQWEEDE